MLPLKSQVINVEAVARFFAVTPRAFRSPLAPKRVPKLELRQEGKSKALQRGRGMAAWLFLGHWFRHVNAFEREETLVVAVEALVVLKHKVHKFLAVDES